MNEYTVTIPAYSRSNVEVAYLYADPTWCDNPPRPESSIPVIPPGMFHPNKVERHTIKSKRRTAEITAKLHLDKSIQPDLYRYKKSTACIKSQRIDKNQHTTKTVRHLSGEWYKWDKLPKALKDMALEPPKYFTTESPFELPSRNADIPDNLAFHVMGCNERANEALDFKPMDDRHFRELCVQASGKNLFLEPRHGAYYVQPSGSKKEVRGRFTRGQTFHDPEWIARKLPGCPYYLAQKLAKAFVDMGINEWKIAKRIMFGIIGSGKIDVLFPKKDERGRVIEIRTEFKGIRLPSAPGLIHYIPEIGPPDVRGLVNAIAIIIRLAERMQEVTYEPAPMVNLDLSENVECDEDTLYWAHADLGPDEVPFTEDELDDFGGDSNPFTAHALNGDGTDALPETIVNCMKSATDFNLSNLAKAVRPYWTEEDGNWIPPNRGMSKPQVNHFWALWKQRRAEITEAVADSMEVRFYLNNLNAIALEKRAAAYIFALRDGRQFMDKGRVIHTGGVRVIPTALKVLWSSYNQRFKKAA